MRLDEFDLDRLPPDKRFRLLSLARTRAQHKRAHPLAWAMLWDNPAPKTSQRRIVQGLPRDVAVVLGGNGCGKSEFVSQLAVAFALGRHHPDAARWARRNGLPPERLPDGPGRVIVSSLTHKDSRKIIRPKLHRYAPPGATWRGRDADDEAELRMPGSDGVRGVIITKANRQGREAFQGDWAHLYILDEEHDEGVFSEIVGRTKRPDVEVEGLIVLSMTPLKGVTWVARKFVPGHALPEEMREGDRIDSRVWWLHSLDSPYVDREAFLRVMSTFGAHEREARLRGSIVALEGRVWESFSRAVHVVEAFEPPAEWPRFSGVDFGVSNPFACVWGALDPRDNVLHVYAERYVRGATLAAHGAAMKERDGGASVMRWADPAGKAERVELGSVHGVQTIPAKNDIRQGVSAVAARFEPDAAGRPHLVVHDSCPYLIREIEGYIWATKAGKGDDPDKPLKRDDHACDALRYMVTGVETVYPLHGAQAWAMF